MRGLKPWSIAATLLAVVSASAVSANPPPDLDDDEPEVKEDEKNGGNAIDKTTEAGTGLPMTGASSLPPEGYAIMGDFLARMATGDLWGAADVITEAWREPDESSSTFGYLAPTDGPAESVLDEIDESQAPLPMVGEAGSQVAVAGAEPTPPPESILDYIDQPAPAPLGAQDPAKPAANQAPAPPVTRSAQ